MLERSPVVQWTVPDLVPKLPLTLRESAMASLSYDAQQQVITLSVGSAVIRNESLIYNHLKLRKVFKNQIEPVRLEFRCDLEHRN